MEYSVTADTIEDAEDLFLLAKERLLDVNAWHELSGEQYALTDAKRQKLHRNAHTGDYIRCDAHATNLYISHIFYDDYPDIAGESLSITMDNANGEQQQTIVIKRISRIVMVQSSTISFIPDAPTFLQALIATGMYEIASY